MVSLVARLLFRDLLGGFFRTLALVAALVGGGHGVEVSVAGLDHLVGVGGSWQLLLIQSCCRFRRLILQPAVNEVSSEVAIHYGIPGEIDGGLLSRKLPGENGLQSGWNRRREDVMGCHLERSGS